MPARAAGVVSAFIATAFAQDHADAAKAQWRQVADQVRPKLPKLAALLDEAEEDVLAYMSFPKEHRAKLHSTNPLRLPTFVNWGLERRIETLRRSCTPSTKRPCLAVNRL
jgi:transposase-like protein